MSYSLWNCGLQHGRLPCPSLSPAVCSNSCPLSWWWCYPTISFSATLFSLGLQSFPASRSFPMSWLFTSDGQRIGTSALASVFPMNIWGWFPLGLAGLIFLQSKRLSRVSSSTTVRKHEGCDPWRGPWSIASISLDHRFCRDRDIYLRKSPRSSKSVLGFGGRVHRKTTFTIV